jgi:dihydroflavonol-4-reductase
MRALVTGATGFLGSCLCRALAARGDEVIALHRPTSILKGLDGLPVQRVTGDIMDPDALSRAMDGVELVFHTAAPMRAEADGRTRFEAHAVGTRHVLRAAHQAHVRRLIHTSSVAALGVPDVPPSTPPERSPLLDERHLWNYIPQRWPYAYAKHASEQEVLRAVEAGLDAVIVNPSVVLGAGDWYRTERSLVAYVAGGSFVPSIPGGLNAVHIQDVVAGHLAAAVLGRRGERYILGGENLTLPELMRITAEVVGRQVHQVPVPLWVFPLLRRALEPLRRSLRLPVNPSMLWLAGYHFFYDTCKARDELGLPPALPYRQAAAETYDWLVRIGAVRSRPGKP